MAAYSAQIKSTNKAIPDWPLYPALYEIDTWIWLEHLTRKYVRPVDLASVPLPEWDAIAEYGFDAVWFMGVWERSPAGIAVANANNCLLADFRRTLPDFRDSDNVGSPYCIRNYSVDPHLGGPKGLAAARLQLAQRGIRLILDFVPNHVAPDNPWVVQHPEYFIRGNQGDAASDPASFIEIGGTIFARGRDPNFPAWPDVLQLNAFSPELRAAAVATLGDIAGQCDGVRCDMAMLPMSAVFERTWGGRAEPRPEPEYWPEVISGVKAQHPPFLFIGEAYWDLEWDLMQQGFDFCYDKKLYDRLEHGSAESVRLHLQADLGYQSRLLRFIENHDEPRAAASFPGDRQRAAAVAIATLPGIRMFHEGEFEGRKVRPPVFLGRRPQEPEDLELQSFYRMLLQAIDHPVFQNGQWSLCELGGWPDNSSFRNLAAWRWNLDDEKYLIVVNLSDFISQGHVVVPWPKVAGTPLKLEDILAGETYLRAGSEFVSPGLYVELRPWSFHFLRCSQADKPRE